ncbi:MAG: hypothetical protein U1E20_12595 [Methylocystis sp.]|uniref:hypothetical protein n=1 Tax=Methylocystis sp. TaxID=1911079 RepID=UPI00393307B8
MAIASGDQSSSFIYVRRFLCANSIRASAIELGFLSAITKAANIAAIKRPKSPAARAEPCRPIITHSDYILYTQRLGSGHHCADRRQGKRLFYAHNGMLFAELTLTSPK